MTKCGRSSLLPLPPPYTRTQMTAFSAQIDGTHIFLLSGTGTDLAGEGRAMWVIVDVKGSGGGGTCRVSELRGGRQPRNTGTDTVGDA